MKKIDIILMCKTVLKKLQIVIVFIIIFAMLFWGITHLQSTDLYESEIKIYVSSSYVVKMENYYIEYLVNIPDCIQLILSNDAIKEVIDNTSSDKNIEEIKENLTVKNLPGTRIISIKYIDSDKKKSEKIVEELKSIATEKTLKLYDNEQILTVDNIYSKLISANTKAKRNAIDGGALGLFLGICYVLHRNKNDFIVKESS